MHSGNRVPFDGPLTLWLPLVAKTRREHQLYRIEGRVAWRHDGTIGVEFVDISSGTLKDLVTHLAAASAAAVAA